MLTAAELGLIRTSLRFYRAKLMRNVRQAQAKGNTQLAEHQLDVIAVLDPLYDRLGGSNDGT